MFPYGRPAALTPVTHRAMAEQRVARTLPNAGVRLPAGIAGDQLDAAVDAIELFHLGDVGYQRLRRNDLVEANAARGRELRAGLWMSLRLLGRSIIGIGRCIFLFFWTTAAAAARAVRGLA